MVVGEPNINNIMGGIENTGSVRLHNHRKKLKQRFDIIKKLGQGTYGKVQLGINKETGQEVAIKTIKKSKIETEADLIRIRREIQIMSSVQHPNIIHIYEVFENREKMVLVMEYAAGGELYDYLSERKVLAEEEARRIFRQIATACYYCHKHKICHRDLKLENILLDEHGNAKIADFGLSNVFDDQRLLSTFCGSPLYASPEIVKGTPYQGPEVDCWSLGVLLYTLVYGAMPFDGSNFKRLVRQISQGDYFEPKKPSRASPLIREMLTVNPRNRANIEKICMHWWVNETYEECCYDISEELANQTPVRLDVLLSLAPPPPQLESEKLVVTDEIAEEAAINSEAAVPTRSQSVGSLMDVTNSAERRIKDMLSDDTKLTPKRKLETTVSTDQANLTTAGVKRKDKIVKESTVADITLHTQPIQENVLLEDATAAEKLPLDKSLTQTLSKSMDVEPPIENFVDLSAQGAACAEIIEDAKKNEAEKTEKLKKETDSAKSNGVEEKKISSNTADKENAVKVEEKTEEKQKESKIPAKRKIVKKKVLNDKNENAEAKPTAPPAEKPKKPVEIEKKSEASEEAQPPSKPVERRRSRIFETTEKFQNMIAASESKPAIDKPKKIVIPGVSVGGFKKEFERKASLTGPSKISLSRKTSLDQDEPVKVEEPVEKPVPNGVKPAEEEKPVAVTAEVAASLPTSDAQPPVEVEKESDKRAKIQNAVSVISNALDGTRKSKSRPCMIKKPPVPFGTSGRSASGSIPTIPFAHSPLTSPTPIGDVSNVHGSIPAQVVEQSDENVPEENITSSAEITLKSATLPRRKTTKAEIKLDYPTPKPATMGFKTEMAHHVEAPPKLTTQRSEVTVPLPINHTNNLRSMSLEPETKLKQQTARERIIPISFESDLDKREPIMSPPIKPPTMKTFQTQRSTISQRSNSLSRQSTQESDSETTISTGEPIRKSPREYIIPIAVEGGGYVTPRASSLEPSETASTTSTMTSKSKFGRSRRFNDREGSEDESPFSLLHRHSSFGRDSDVEDPRRDMFRMHSLRSSRPRKATIEHNDSFSSGEDDDDDGFEILTAENLFSTLLSRVRDLTQRINVDGRPSFPTSRLLSSHFDHGSNFWNMPSRLDPLSRYAPVGRTSREPSVDSSNLSRDMGVPWRRSVSRDLATDIDSVFKSPVQTPTHTATLPRGDTNNENLNLTDLNLRKLKLSDEDALALSYLTPGLSRRIQKQLFAQLAPSEARKLSRTLSMRNSTDSKTASSSDEKPKYKSTANAGCSNTLPRRYSVESNPTRNRNAKTHDEPNLRESSERSKSVFKEREDSKLNKSFLPVVKSPFNRDCYSSCDRVNESQRSRRSKSPNPLPKYENYLLGSNTSTTDGPSSPSTYSESSRLVKYLSPTKFGESGGSDVDFDQNTEVRRRRSPSMRRTSRFLRPDFFDPPKESNNYYLRERKEREIETQKVLKEIRDKRKGRFRDGSTSRESCKLDEDDATQDKTDAESFKQSTSDLTQNLLKKVSDNIKNIESNVKDFQNNDTMNKVPDYVNQTSVVNSNNGNENRVVNPHYVSENRVVNSNYGKEIRVVNSNYSNDNRTVSSNYVNENRVVSPNYVNENRVVSPNYVNENRVVNPNYTSENRVAGLNYASENSVADENRVVKKERVSKIARPKSYPNEAHLVSKIAEFDKTKAKTSKLKKNCDEGDKMTQNKKIEKGKEEQSSKSRLLQTIERKFEKLRSFSNSPNSVSSEDARSREEKKSLVEDTIKRLREQSLPRNIEPCNTESALLKRAVSVEDLITADPKQLQPSRKSVTKILNLFKKYEEKQEKKNEKAVKTKKSGKEESTKKSKEDSKKPNKIKNGQLERKTDKAEANPSPGAVSVITNTVEKSDINVNKLGLNKKGDEVEPQSRERAERPRSLLLDPAKRCQPTYNGAKSETNITADREVKRKVSKLPVTSYRRSLNLENAQFEPSAFYSVGNHNAQTQQNSHLNHSMLNLHSPEQVPSTSGCDTNRNSLALTDDSSVYLSPCDDNDNMSYDSWSVCSDYQNQDLTSPLSPCNNFYSADESESVSDRIRRKSFYTRFNEKKRPRKNTFSSYRDLDLYKEMNSRKFGGESYNRKEYVRNNSASLNDSLSYVNSDKYEMYGPKVNTRRSSSVYLLNNSEESTNILDDNSTAEQNRNYSYYNPTSRFHNNAPNLSTNGHHMEEMLPSLNQNIRQSTSQHQL